MSDSHEVMSQLMNLNREIGEIKTSVQAITKLLLPNGSQGFINETRGRLEELQRQRESCREECMHSMGLIREVAMSSAKPANDALSRWDWLLNKAWKLGVMLGGLITAYVQLHKAGVL